MTDMMKIFVKHRKSRDHVARDLHTPKYRMRVVSSEKIYNREKEKRKFREELIHG